LTNRVVAKNAIFMQTTALTGVGIPNLANHIPRFIYLYIQFEEQRKHFSSKFRLKRQNRQTERWNFTFRSFR
jgi:hypothetical protein